MTQNNWTQFIQNPKSQAVRKWLQEFLKERYPKYDDFADRLALGIVTQQDLESFGHLLVDIYEVGYLKAVNDYKQQLDQLGIKVKITSQ